MAKEEKYLLRLLPATAPDEMALLASSSVTELGREESHSGRRSKRSAGTDEDEEELPLESREAVVVVSVEDDDVEEDASRRVRTIDIRGERCRGRSWPL